MMQIRIASLQDIPALEVLVQRAYRGEESRKGWTTEADLLEGTRIDRQTLESYLEDPSVTLLVGLEEGELMSCVYLQKFENSLYLGLLTVDPQRQARGAGRQLLAAADDYARNAQLPLIRITVISDRTDLIQWYERNGFSKTGRQVPFPTEEKYGLPKKKLEMLVLEKQVLSLHHPEERQSL